MKESFNPDHLLGRRYSNDWTREQLEGYASSTTTAHGVTIPVNVEIEANQKILDFSSIEEILKKASKYAVVDCVCRTTLENCDAPKDVCLAFDEYADKTVENGERNPRYLTYEEALDTVKRAQEAGLVHMAYTNKNEDYPNSICGCCTCCCGILGAVMRFGVSLPFPLVTSDKIAEYYSGKCISCGICVDRCHFDAWEKVDGKMVYRPERCFGCSNCTTTCPTQAIQMTPRNN